jgi:PAS domain S-box-containing protein
VREHEQGDADASHDKELLDLAGLAYLVTDSYGKIGEANRAAADLLGVSPGFLIGKPLASFVPEGDRRDFRQRLLELDPSPEVTRFRTWLEPRSQRPFMAELHVTRDWEEPERLALRWTLADITPQTSIEVELRLLAEELEQRVRERTAALLAESARLAAVVENMPAGLIFVDAQGKPGLANDNALRILGAQGSSDQELSLEKLPLERTLRTGEAVDNERVDLVGPDGSTVVLEVSTAPIRDQDGQTVGGLALFHDVTEQDRHERAEREFVTNAAHQLQSPLSGIISAIEVLQGGAKDGPERDVFLGHIERESGRLARLARALLILARAQTGVETPKDELVALEPLLSEVGGTLRPAAGVTVEVACPPDLAVVTNRELVEQALRNVAENAAKYTSAGRITLEARRLDGAVEIVVADTGRGIPESEQPRVPERFYRGAEDTDGFGLGFAIVRSAVEALEGELEIDGADGGGTVVRFRLRPAASLVESQ